MEGRRPSDLAGIGCDYCAFCFDDALLARRGAALKKLEEDRAQDRDMDRMSELNRFAREG